MGLDVSSYTDVQFICETPEDVACKYTWFEENFDTDTHVVLWENPHFPDQFEGLNEGVYRVNPSGEEVNDYPRWSYSGYNHFRNLLAQAVGYTSSQDCWERVKLNKDLEIEGNTLPLSDLICFSDCEGVFSTEACKRISSGFAEVDFTYFLEEGYSLRQLKLLIAVFKDAAENHGVVVWC